MTKTTGNPAGFSLAEMLAALVIGALVLTAILAVYSQADRSAATILDKVESTHLAEEVLQLIAEDLDTIVASGSDVVVSGENKFDNGLAKARFVIRTVIYDAENKPKVYEQITWLADFDYESGMPGLILYRSHEGIALEDRLLDDGRQDWERSYPFVPVCRGITYFKIEFAQGENFLDRWTSATLPPGIKITISFAEPFETMDGTLDVFDEDKTSRTIAIDGTRDIKFTMAPYVPAELSPADPNVPGAAGQEGADGLQNVNGQDPNKQN